MSINVCTFTGNLGRDAEVRYTATGKAVTAFSVPVESGFGERKKTAWVRCSAWGERFEKLAPYLTKGKPVTVTGEISLNEYESNGEQRTSLELNVRDIALQGGRKDKPAQQGFRDEAREESPVLEGGDCPF